MKDIVKLTLKLFIICAVAAALLGVTYAVTKEPIKQGNMMRAIQSRQEVLGLVDDFKEIDVESLKRSGEFSDDIENKVTVSEAFYGMKDGAKSGMTVKVMTKGYNPGIEMTVGFLPDGSISAISIGSHEETPGLGANAADPSFKDQFLSLMPYVSLGSKEGEIDSITSATKTSVGVINGVNTAYDFFKIAYDKE